MLINIENQIDEDEFIALTEREDVQDERLILVALVGHRMKFSERSGGGFKTPLACEQALILEPGHRIRNRTRRDTSLMLGGSADIGLHTPARERRPCS